MRVDGRRWLWEKGKGDVNREGWWARENEICKHEKLVNGWLTNGSSQRHWYDICYLEVSDVQNLSVLRRRSGSVAISRSKDFSASQRTTPSSVVASLRPSSTHHQAILTLWLWAFGKYNSNDDEQVYYSPFGRFGNCPGISLHGIHSCVELCTSGEEIRCLEKEVLEPEL